MFLRVGDLVIHVRVAGPVSAPPLLLLHSLGTSQVIWDAQADALRRSFRIIRPDMRGHGLTTTTPGPYDMATLAADALGVLDQLGIKAAHVAGISIGGLIAQDLVSQAPERVLSLTLIDTALTIPSTQSWRDRAAAVRTEGLAPLADIIVDRWVTPAFRGSPDAAGLRTMLLHTPREGYAGASEAIATADFTGTSPAIRCRTLVIVGEDDEATPVRSAEALRDAVPGALLSIIPAAAHIPLVQQPDAVLEVMQSFLSPPAADAFDAGMAVRRQVLGEEHVARATSAITALDRDFQSFITRTAWGSVWTRSHFDRRTRSIITLSLMAALGHHEEFALHVRASRNTGATDADIAELLIQVAAYAGIPAANAAIRVAKQTLEEMTSRQSDS